MNTNSQNSNEETPTRIVIVGGVAGGATAAARARRCDAQAEITILEKGPAVSFANCGLPYHIGGEIEDRDKLLVATPELFWNRLRVRVRTEHEVTQIDRGACTVTGLDAEGEEFKLPYDRLILATGSKPIEIEALSRDAENVFQLWSLSDMDEILEYMKRRPCRKALVIGAGFVGLEVVEQIAARGMGVVLVERLPQVLGPLDFEMARLVEKELLKSEVDLKLGANAEQLLISSGRATAAKLDNGETVATDLVIVGAGVRPRIELAEQNGLSIGAQGGVEINEFCQTSDPNVYAVGDMVEYQHRILGSAVRMPLAGPANRAGRIAGEHAVRGSSPPLPPVAGTAIVRVFGTTAGTTGLNERACQQAGLRYRSATIQAPHHASYFPGAKTLTLKLIYDDNGKILGAQGVGAEGVDKRMDVIATALQFGGTVQDLVGLDLSYAPPFGSAKDPIHMVAFAAQNDLAEKPELVPYDADLAGKQVVDVRAPSELEKLPTAEGAINIPVDELADRTGELDPDLPTIVVCHSGKRAHVAACRLQSLGFSSVQNLSGGMSIRRYRREQVE
ncbi:MAG: FAD-dependent oxidoreductase [Planctomycetota bacterium]